MTPYAVLQHSFLWKKKRQKKLIFCLGYWCLLVFMVAAFAYLTRNSSSLQQCPKTHLATEGLSKIVQMFFEQVYQRTPMDECLSRMYITKLQWLANNTLSVMVRVVKVVAISKQTQKDLMEPPRRYFEQNIHITTKSLHIMKRIKPLISKCFCAL